MAIDPRIPLMVHPFSSQMITNPLLPAQQLGNIQTQQTNLALQPLRQQLLQEQVNQAQQSNQQAQLMDPVLLQARKLLNQQQQTADFAAAQKARTSAAYDLAQKVDPLLKAGDISGAKRVIQKNINSLASGGLSTEDPTDLYSMLDNNEFDKAKLAVKTILDQYKPQGQSQFGAQQTFKDEQGNLFFGTTQRNPATGEVNTVLAPIGNGPAQPVGQVNLTSSLGLTAEQQIEQKKKEAQATEKGKLGAQAKLMPKIRADIKQAETLAAQQGTELSSLGRAKAALPGLKEVVNKLTTLADMATYTTGGRVFDTVVKELGFGATKGATSRAKMVSLVDNQVLPLLRQTFGSAFTEREGNSLRATMLDPNAPPEVKKATLQSFLDQKIRDIETSQRQVNITQQQMQNPNQATQQPMQQQNIPNAAIEYLKANPKLRDQFDAKYGQGSAAQILGQ